LCDQSCGGGGLGRDLNIAIAAPVLGAVAIVASVETGMAQSRVPAPEFMVESQFEEMLARRFAGECDVVEFDHAGFDRHYRALLVKLSDHGVTARSLQGRYAPVQPERFAGLATAFQQKYDLNGQSTVAAYCDAAVAEAEWRTPVGRMLKIVGGQ
jgi:hypothetical protein